MFIPVEVGFDIVLGNEDVVDLKLEADVLFVNLLLDDS